MEYTERKCMNAEPTITLAKADFEKLMQNQMKIDKNSEIKIISKNNRTHLYIDGVDISDEICSIAFSHGSEDYNPTLIVGKCLM